MMPRMRPRYVPALRFHALTPWYDRVVRATTRETTAKTALIRQAGIEPGQRVLDLACGTGTLALLIDATVPGVQVTGIDGDPAILAIARHKSLQAGRNLRFEHGDATALPFPDHSFDRVVSSLFFHHLPTDGKLAAAREALRVLKPGGVLHVLDWGRPTNPLMRALFVAVRCLDGFGNTRDNVRGALPAIFRDAGFASAAERGCLPTALGSLWLYSAVREGGCGSRHTAGAAG